MKKRIIMLLVIAMLVLAIPVSAAKNEPVGDRINVLDGSPDTYPAEEAFHILQGWRVNPQEGPVGKWDFELFVDGVYRNEDYKINEVDHANDPNFLDLGHVYNFPAGMTGIHTFKGIWYAPCSWAAENGVSVQCDKKNESVPVINLELTVTFVP